MMRVGLLPIAVFLALGVAALATWALIRVITAHRVSHRVSARYAIVLMVCCLALWLGLCYFFIIFASLGHSAYPLRDSQPQCLVSFLALIVAPLTLLVWLARRRSG
jgi:hypothetical protein